MALVICADCTKSISDAAPACPHCGKPMAAAHLRPSSRVARRLGLVGALALGAVGLYEVRHAHALGVPTVTPLVYSGSLVTYGSPDNSSHIMNLSLFIAGANDGGIGSAACTTTESVTCVNGQFSIPLSTSCMAVVEANPNLQVEVTVDNSSLGLVNVTAVPYAIVAGTAAAVSGVVTVSNGGTGSTTQNFVMEDSATGEGVLPSGSTAQRTSSPADGMIRYNTTTASIEAYVGGVWTTLSNASRNHTEWGSTACASGATPFYSGYMGAMLTYEPAYTPTGSGAICVDSNTGGTWTAWGSGYASVQRVEYAGSNGRQLLASQIVNCVVCPGAELVDWGVSTCPAGWNTAYVGHAGGIANGWASYWSGSGGVSCLNDSSWSSWTSLDTNGLFWRADQNDTTYRGSYLNGGALSCALCYQ